METSKYNLIIKCMKTLLPLCLIALSACEKDVVFKGSTEEKLNNMVINAVAVEGDSLRVFLNHTYSIGQQPVMQYINYQYAMYSNSDYLTDYRNNSYYKNTRITNAEVTALVNDSQTYRLELAKDSMSFLCDYKPQENDHIVVKVRYLDQNREKEMMLSNEAIAETIVPAKPKIEVLKHEVLKDSSYYEVNQLYSFSDTIMRITCRISDMGGNQYYRLRIRGERALVTETWYNPIYDRPSTYNYYLRFQDVYYSDDPLFVDASLNKNNGGWPAYFSNVFDNSLMQGADYCFTLDSPKPNSHFSSTSAHNPLTGEIIVETKIVNKSTDFDARVMVELEAISPEYYRYLKSVQLYQVSKSDAFSEPVQIYSNVHNGWGIFGSLSFRRIFIPYD